MKPVVGLTGGIACGKSTVASMFAELGAAVIDADQLARDVVKPGSDGLRRVVEAFGEEVVDPDGALDRKRLGDVVFNDEDARMRLNAILHPLIAQAGAQQIAVLGQGEAPYILYEAALLVENNAYKMFSALVVVSCARQTQMDRLTARDGIDEQEARTRIDSQSTTEAKVAVADHVIKNDGDLAETRAQVARVHAALTKR